MTQLRSSRGRSCAQKQTSNSPHRRSGSRCRPSGDLTKPSIEPGHWTKPGISWLSTRRQWLHAQRTQNKLSGVGADRHVDDVPCDHDPVLDDVALDDVLAAEAGPLVLSVAGTVG